MRAVFPGTFNPPTTAHLAIAAAVEERCGCDHLDFVLSRAPLGKDGLVRPTVDERAAVLRMVCADMPHRDVVVTDARLVVDVARGYDVLVVGTDKWEQIVDAAWYDSPAARDAALRVLPQRVLVVPRAGITPTPSPLRTIEILDVDAAHAHTSSTQARNGDASVIVPEAAASGLWDTAS